MHGYGVNNHFRKQIIAEMYDSSNIIFDFINSYGRICNYNLGHQFIVGLVC